MTKNGISLEAPGHSTRRQRAVDLPLLQVLGPLHLAKGMQLLHPKFGGCTRGNKEGLNLRLRPQQKKTTPQGKGANLATLTSAERQIRPLKTKRLGTHSKKSTRSRQYKIIQYVPNAFPWVPPPRLPQGCCYRPPFFLRQRRSIHKSWLPLSSPCFWGTRRGSNNIPVRW